jgi:hypothetical protein
MTIYVCYTIFFLFLLLRKKGLNRTFSVTESETKLILLGLVIYCASYLVTTALIKSGLKTESYYILSHHVILLAICLFLYIKMLKTHDPQP